jgi:RNA polymerase sigma-70 factor (ECF subfamily)
MLECKAKDTLEFGLDEPGLRVQPLSVEQVVHEYGASVYAVARRMLGNDADADDVSQEVLLQVVRKLNTFRGESSLFTWLYRITCNAVLALRRERAHNRECQVQHPVDNCLEDGFHSGPPRSSMLPPDKQVLSREARGVIDAAIARLPRIYREVYVLGDIEELSNAEIGKILELSLPAVKSRLHRARRMLRCALACYFEKTQAWPAATVWPVPCSSR